MPDPAEVDGDGLRRRLAFQASRRSMAEMEQVLSRFMAVEREKLDAKQCSRLLRVLEHPDADLLDWLTGIRQVPGDLDVEALFWLEGYREERMRSVQGKSEIALEG
ncbi:MAG: succinate dehydrogenase assembly factor 2 [Magnetococcales bacterium]|nr:succinate dehydrogenase assembly factor 2 [Magnetococcales bacterium]